MHKATDYVPSVPTFFRPTFFRPLFLFRPHLVRAHLVPSASSVLVRTAYDFSLCGAYLTMHWWPRDQRTQKKTCMS